MASAARTMSTTKARVVNKKLLLTGIAALFLATMLSHKAKELFGKFAYAGGK